MTDREKYRTRAGYYLLTRNNTRAIEELNQLIKQYPADMAGLYGLEGQRFAITPDSLGVASKLAELLTRDGARPHLLQPGEKLEESLREVLYLVLSTPEYQLG